MFAVKPVKPFVRMAGLCLGLLLTGAAILQAQPYGLTQRPAVGKFLNGQLPEVAPNISTNWTSVVAFPNLLFTNAVGLTSIPGTNKLWVWEREGRVYSFSNSPAANQKTLVLDISNQCQGWDDSGLLGLAFHPGFATNGYVFIYYTWVLPGTVAGGPSARPANQYNPGAYHDRLSRFTANAAGVVIPGSELVLIDQVGNHVWHNGGGMFFHPGNGFLYVTDGDDADANLNTQRIDRNLFSGLWRIDVDKRGGSISHPIVRQPLNGTTANYFIPNDNPFVGQANALEEFYAIGLRSPHRMTHDPVSNRIFIGDVGDGSWEEVTVIEPTDPPGLNLQWSRIEGLNGDLTQPYIGVNKRPIIHYSHSDGWAVIGGYVYRGTEFVTELGGIYIFGDNQGWIWRMDESTVPATKVLLCQMPLGSGPEPGGGYTGLSSFGLDQNNELYFCQMSSIGGRIFKLAKSGPPSANTPFPPLLSQTGAFSDLATLTPTNALIPYTVNSPLWSDAAVKQRWIVVPTNTTVGFTPTGEWAFPAGTVFVKHFDLPVNDTNQNILRRLETRLLVMDTNGASYGITYKWRTNYTDADLVTTAVSEDIAIQTATGTRTQPWYFPSPADCLRCHTPNANHVLGVKTRQQNGNLLFPGSGVMDNQLRAWNHIGLFSPPLNEATIPSYDKLVSVTNAAASLEYRVRSYLDANCAQCHRPGGVLALWDARYDTPLANQNIISGSVLNNLGIAGAKEVAPQDIVRSLMHRRMATLDASKMPPLARNTIDSNAVTVLTEWINSLIPTTTTLPPPWVHEDIGGVGVTGEATFTSGTFTIMGGGDDIWNQADAFHFAYRPWTNNCEIIARVVGLQPTDVWAKAGVMIRENTGAGSRHAMMVLTSGNGVSFQRRLVPNGNSFDTTTGSLTVPYWVRLVRNSNTFTGYASANGSSWTQIGTDTIAMSSNILIGLAVTAHNNGAVNTAVFDNVSGSFPPPATTVGIVTQPQNVSVSLGQSGMFQVVANGPWAYQWYSNNVGIAGATANTYTTPPLADVSGTQVLYKVVVSDGTNQVTSDSVHLVLVTPLPANVIFYDGFEYAAGPLGTLGGWSSGNISQVRFPGLTYTDATGNVLLVRGNSLVFPNDWNQFSNIPTKLIGSNVYGGFNTTNYLSFVFDFRNMNNSVGAYGLSVFHGITGWGDERLYIGKTGGSGFLGLDGAASGASAVGYHTNGLIVLRIAQNGTTTAFDLFVNPLLSALPSTPALTRTVNGQMTFNAVGVNAGDWGGASYTPPGPLVDEIRFGSTYASVTPIQPRLTIQVSGTNVQVSWPAAVSGAVLQTSDSLTGPAWSPAPPGNPVVIPIDRTARYFRLLMN